MCFMAQMLIYISAQTVLVYLCIHFTNLLVHTHFVREWLPRRCLDELTETNFFNYVDMKIKHRLLSLQSLSAILTKTSECKHETCV